MSRRPPAPRSMSLILPDGQGLDIGIEPDGVPLAARITLGEAIRYRSFENCPICGALADSDEHVPPKSLGGNAMTRTCTPCNNTLGGRVEDDLRDWFDHAITLPRFDAESVRGTRRANRILRRTDVATGKFVWILDDPSDPAIIDMLRSGQIDVSGLEPDPNRCRLALLKQAYLAECMKDGVLEGPRADQIRHDLVAARDAPTKGDIPVSASAQGLTVLRFHGEEPFTSALVVAATVHMAPRPLDGVVLLGQIFVSWPSSSPDGETATQQRVQISFDVEEPLDGVVEAVRP